MNNFLFHFFRKITASTFAFCASILLCQASAKSLDAQEKIYITMDFQTEKLLNHFNAQKYPPIETQTVEQVRKNSEFYSYPSPIHLKKIEDKTIIGPSGNIPIRIYYPNEPKRNNLPMFVTFHGGGWIAGNLLNHDPFCREVCQNAHCIVISVDYRLAPENKFPIPLEDCYAAVQWASNNASTIGGDASKIAIGGDSAGGNLTAAVALLAKDRKGPKISKQILLYPVTTSDLDSSSYIQYSEGYFLTKNAMKWFWQNYLPSEKDGNNPYASPLKAKNLTNLPSALIICSEFDVLRDDGLSYAHQLQAAGVDVTTTIYPTIHAFISFANQLEVGKIATDDVVRHLQAAFFK